MIPKKRILVVDDTSDTLGTIFELLTSEGYLVCTATSGFQALEVVSRERPDLVVCDLRMPEMDGMELLQKLQAAAPGIKFLFLTAYGSWPRFIEALDRGAIDMLQKPCPNEEFVRAVRGALGEPAKV